MKTFIVLITFLTLSNCNSVKNTSETSKTSNLNNEYRVITVQGIDVKDFLMTANFNSKENILNGFAGCNTFFGKFSIEKNEVKFFDIGSTKKYCPTGDKSKMEEKFINTLSKTTRFKELENNAMLFFNEDGEEIMHLQL